MITKMISDVLPFARTSGSKKSAPQDVIVGRLHVSRSKSRFPEIGISGKRLFGRLT